MKKFLYLLTTLLIVLGVAATTHAYQFGYGLAGVDVGSLGVYYNDRDVPASAYVGSVGRLDVGGSATAYDDTYGETDYYNNVMDGWAEAYSSSSFAMTGIVPETNYGGPYAGSLAAAGTEEGINEQAGAFSESTAYAYTVYSPLAGDLTISIDYYLAGAVDGDDTGYAKAGSSVMMSLYDDENNGSNDGRWFEASTYGIEYYEDGGTLYATILGLEEGDMFTFFVGTAAYAYATESMPVPEPATLLLLGTGFIGLAGMGRRKIFKK